MKPGELVVNKYTYEELQQFPEDGHRYEIIDGDLLVTPSPVTHHQRVLRALFRAVDAHVVKLSLGEVFFAPLDVYFSEQTVVEPDLIYVSRARQGQVKAKYIQGAPDLAVEILSPSSIQNDRKRKFDAYARYGIPHYWIVDPDARTVDEYRLEGTTYRLVARLEGETTFRPGLFPELELPLATLFAE